MYDFGFIGFRHGHVGSLYKLASQNPRIRIAAACEKDDIARKQAADLLGVEFTHSDPHELIKDKSIDVIVIGDYFGARGDIAISALKAGKHIYADKPLCTSLSQIDEIERLQHETGLKAGLMLDLRYARFAAKARELTAGGELGEIRAVFFGGQHPLLYGRRPQWYYEKGKHGGTINDIAIHGIDMIEYLTGAVMKKVICARCWNAYAVKEPDFRDCAQFMIEMTNGAGVAADVSYSSPDSIGYALPIYWRFTLWGSRGMMEFSYNSDTMMIARDGKGSVDTIMLPEAPACGCLDDFIDELDGKKASLDSGSVIRVTREALLIQKAADML